MGAASSVKAVYGTAVDWFQNYFDALMYVQDFDAMDKDNDGGITYHELQKWIESKANTEGGSWKILISHEEVLKVAHIQAAARLNQTAARTGQKVFGIDDFRIFLIQLFAISVLFVHFKNADDNQNSYDFGNMLLSPEEFKMAVKTLTESHEGEHVSDEQIQADFERMDVDNSNSLSFLEVCSYCCQFINFCKTTPLTGGSIEETGAEPQSVSTEEKLRLMQEEEDKINAKDSLSEDVSKRRASISSTTMNMLDSGGSVVTGSKVITGSSFSAPHGSVKDRNIQAVDVLKEELEKNKQAAKMTEARQDAEAEIMALLSQ